MKCGSVQVFVFREEVEAFNQKWERLFDYFFILTVEATWNWKQYFGDMNLVSKLVDLRTEKFNENLYICVQLLVPAEQGFERASLNTFDASRN